MPEGALTAAGENFPARRRARSPHASRPSANTWVRGYPSVLYGINQCSAATSPPVSPACGFPCDVSSIPADLIGTTSYSLGRHTSPTTSPTTCGSTTRTPPGRARQTERSRSWCGPTTIKGLLPESVQTGTASVPFKVNGTLDPGNGAWSVFVSNVFRGGAYQPWGGTVWFILNEANVVNTGTVSVDLSTVLSEVGTLLQNNYGWHNFRAELLAGHGPVRDGVRSRKRHPTGSGSAYFSCNSRRTAWESGRPFHKKATCGGDEN